MHLLLITALAMLPFDVFARQGCPNYARAVAEANANDDDNNNSGSNNPGGAAAIESAVTSYLSATSLSPQLSSLAPALSSAGVTGVVLDSTAIASATATATGNGNGNGNGNGGNSQSPQTFNGVAAAAATAAPQVILAGAVGAVVLGVW